MVRDLLLSETATFGRWHLSGQKRLVESVGRRERNWLKWRPPPPVIRAVSTLQDGGQLPRITNSRHRPA